MPLDVIRRILTPLGSPIVTSRYPEAPALLPAAARRLPMVDAARCDRNAACVTACPTGAITLTAEAGWSVDAGKCVLCDACADACPAGAISSLDGPAPAYKPAGAGDPAGAAAERLRAALAAKLGRSLHVRHLDAGSCNGCDWEISALLNPYHDVQRLGIDFVASPRHADLLLVTGIMTRNLREAAIRTYESMAEPRLVVAVGACAISGGVFAGSPEGGDGAASALPVDVLVPGCPPRPESIIEGMLTAVGRLPVRA
jgi:Ni,Fe-hydrogenase III small subunit/NAD-dependent dihydropyrimidine dehydrogenase PreA subunit